MNVNNNRLFTSSKPNTFLFHNEIGPSGVSSSVVSRQLFELENDSDVYLKINSPGGSVVEGFGIISTLNQIPNKTIAIVEGLAASMASVIACSCDKVLMNDFAVMLVHKPFSENADDDVIETFQNNLVKIYLSKTGLSKDRLNDLMNANDGEGTLMDAETALSLGFVDEIIETKQKKIEGVKNTLKLYSIYNSILNKPKMEKLTSVLGLTNEASEDSIVSAVNSLKKENEATTKELTSVKAQLATKDEELKKLNNDLKEASKAKALELVENAIKEGKISSDSGDIETVKAHWVEQASTENGFFAVKNMFDSIKTEGHSNILGVISNVTTLEVEDDADDSRSDWDHIKWQKEDPKGLAEMQNSSPEKYNNLYEKTYLS